SFFPGAKIGVLGVNGSGKSSLLRIMAGEDKEFEGEAVPMPNMRIGYLPQEPQLAPDKTVRETIEEGLGEIFDAKQKLEDIYAAYAEPDADFDKLAAEQARYEAIIATAGADTDVQMEIAADALRLAPWEAKIGKLSGGEKRRVALYRLLLSKPDMLLLDEPTNHLDAESVEWLEQFLQKFPGTVIAVTHDRYFLDNAAEWILALDPAYDIPGKDHYSSSVDETRESLPNDKTAWQAISGGQDILTVGKFEMPSRAYLGRFNFKGADQQKNVGALSGGERGRLHLAATLLKGGNVLLLDEPSN